MAWPNKIVTLPVCKTAKIQSYTSCLNERRREKERNRFTIIFMRLNVHSSIFDVWVFWNPFYNCSNSFAPKFSFYFRGKFFNLWLHNNNNNNKRFIMNNEHLKNGIWRAIITSNRKRLYKIETYLLGNMFHINTTILLVFHEFRT